MQSTWTDPFFRTPCPRNSQAPLFIYLPGMDGTGELLRRQLEGLERGFDIRCLAIPPDDLTDWDHLTHKVVDLIRLELIHNPQQTIYLCGESFGGCLALKVILQAPDLFDRLILINPASSFTHQFWIYWGSFLARDVPEAVYRLACVAFLPFLASLERMEEGDRRALLTAMQSVTQQSALWRISLLREFKVTDTQLSQIKQPTLVVAGGRDRLLPSVEEADRLVQDLPLARRHILPISGHACLLETDINLYTLLQDSEFLPQSPVVMGAGSRTL